MTRVLIADDHPVVREGYRFFLEEDASITEIGEADTGIQTLVELRRQRWDLLIMDIQMPGRSGLDILPQVVAGYPELGVLIVSSLPEAQYARNLLRAGARGFLSKESAPEDLLRAVRLILQGRRYVSANLADFLVEDFRAAGEKNQPLHSVLSEREFQVFFKLAAGAGVSTIARELCLSVKTVGTYRARIFEKMGLKSIADATGYALRNGLME